MITLKGRQSLLNGAAVKEFEFKICTVKTTANALQNQPLKREILLVETSVLGETSKSNQIIYYVSQGSYLVV